MFDDDHLCPTRINSLRGLSPANMKTPSFAVREDACSHHLTSILRACLSGCHTNWTRDMTRWSRRTRLPPCIVAEFPDAAWDWTFLSLNSAIPIHFILACQHLRWDWTCVSRRLDVTQDVVDRNPDVTWDASALRARLIDCSDIIHPLEPAHQDDVGMANAITEMAEQKTLTCDTLRANLHLPLDFGALSRYKSVHDVVFERTDLPWNWSVVSIYADIDRFFTHPDLLDPSQIVLAGLGASLRRHLAAVVTVQSAYRTWKARRHVAAIRLQRAFVRAYWDPGYIVCKRRLKRNVRDWGLDEGDGVARKRVKVA